MANRWTNTLTHNDITPQAEFLNRRQLIAGAAAGVGLAGIGGAAQAQAVLEPNSWEDITQYNKSSYPNGIDGELVSEELYLIFHGLGNLEKSLIFK